MSLDIYSENVLDHYNNPRNFGKLENFNASARDLNPICGDEIKVFLQIADGKITNAKFEGHGCAISQAAASMLTEEIKGKSATEIKHLQNNFVTDLLGVNLSALRLRCALLSLNVLKLAVYDYFGKTGAQNQA